MSTISGTVITLPQLLASRDDRQVRQRAWLKSNPGYTLAVLTIVMPGNIKRDSLSIKAAEAGVNALRAKFGSSIHKIETYDLVTGYEAFLLVKEPLAEAKLMTCDIEDRHPLGRLFDIDVIDSSGVPVSRSSLGLPSRRCLLCDGDARVCMRTRAHSYNDLRTHIKHMIEAFIS